MSTVTWESFILSMGWSWSGFYYTLSRKKPIEDSTESKLAKVLSVFDLTTLGIGSTLGVGVYVLAGQVSKIYSGPAVILSFLIAAIASIFAGLCYAEFGARVPRAGSAYVYSYVTIGEFIAFIIGWNLILEYTIGSASVAKGLSSYLDNLCGHKMEDFLRTHLPMHLNGFNDYPDIFAFAVTILFTLAIATGAKESTRLNTVFTLLNLSVVLLVIIAGLCKVSIANWNLPKSSIPEGYGDGGFAPYGIAGIIRGAAICFYGFIGFDCIATAGEEAKNPKKSIPIAVIMSLAMVFLAYFAISTVLTMMIPYHQQDESAPLVYVFSIYDRTTIEYTVSIGAICAMCTSLMGSMFPLPRIVYAMASDGLLFQCMADISLKYKTPLNSTLLTGFLTAIFAAIFNLKQLVNMMSIGTLLAYSMVAACVLILRYDCEYQNNNRLKNVRRNSLNGCSNYDYSDNNEYTNIWKLIFNTSNLSVPTEQSSRLVTIMICIYVFQCLWLTYILQDLETNFQSITGGVIAVLLFIVMTLTISLYIISRQPVSNAPLSFRVPMVPWLPGFSILINVYLMIKLDIITWIRFSVWILIGLLIYFSYSIRNSRLRNKEMFWSLPNEESQPEDSIEPIQMQYIERHRHFNQVPLMAGQIET